MKNIDNNKKIIAVLILIILISSLLYGCNNNTLKSTSASGNTVVDYLGRKVQLPKEVNKVACLYAFCGHAMALTGSGGKIISVVEGLKRDKLLKIFVPSVESASVPFTSGSINIEELIKAKPDVAFIRATTASSDGEMSKLNSAVITAVVVDYQNMQQQMAAVELVGKVCGDSAYLRAKLYSEYYQHCIDLCKERVKDMPESQKIRVYHSVNEATRTDTKDSLPADWMEAAGVKNVSLDKQLNIVESNAYASLEQIYLWDPQVIIANEPGVSKYILTDSKWKGLQAVLNKKVYQMPLGLSRWGHPGSIETPLAMLWLDKTLYPQLFKDVDLVKETKYFYKTFFDYDLTDQQVSAILSGTEMRLSKGEQ